MRAERGASAIVGVRATFCNGLARVDLFDDSSSIRHRLANDRTTAETHVSEAIHAFSHKTPNDDP